MHGRYHVCPWLIECSGVSHCAISRFLAGLSSSGCIANKTGRLVHPTVQGNSLFNVMGQKTNREYGPIMLRIVFAHGLPKQEDSMLLYVHRGRTDNPWTCIYMSMGLSGTGSPGRPPPLSHSSCDLSLWSSVLLYVHRDHVKDC